MGERLPRFSLSPEGEERPLHSHMRTAEDKGLVDEVGSVLGLQGLEDISRSGSLGVEPAEKGEVGWVGVERAKAGLPDSSGVGSSARAPQDGRICLTTTVSLTISLCLALGHYLEEASSPDSAGSSCLLGSGG